MKRKEVGRKYSRRIIEAPENELDFRALMNDHDPYSFPKMMAWLVKSSEDYLKHKGHLATLEVYECTDKPIEYEVSDDPGDIEKAKQYERLKKLYYEAKGVAYEETEPSQGTRLKAGIESEWQSEVPKDGYKLGSAKLDHYFQKIKGFDHDSVEVICAKMICMVKQLDSTTGEARDDIIFQLGSLKEQRIRNYDESKKQNIKAKAPKNKILNDLLNDLAHTRYDCVEMLVMWDKLIEKLENEDCNSEVTGKGSKQKVTYEVPSGKRISLAYPKFQERLKKSELNETHSHGFR